MQEQIELFFAYYVQLTKLIARTRKRVRFDSFVDLCLPLYAIFYKSLTAVSSSERITNVLQQFCVSHSASNRPKH